MPKHMSYEEFGINAQVRHDRLYGFLADERLSGIRTPLSSRTRGLVIISRRPYDAIRSCLENILRLASKHNIQILIIHESGTEARNITSNRYFNTDLCEVRLQSTLYDANTPVFKLEQVSSGNRISSFRNTAVQYAKQHEWSHLAFMDDDILIHESTFLKLWHRLDNGYSMAACNSVAFPDNSVLFHILGCFGFAIRTFISANVLAINLESSSPHFPGCYNEDWLYIFARLLQGKPVAWVGSTYQLPYNPYRAERAVSEELGDIVAEGIAEALTTTEDVVTVLRSDIFWKLQIKQRAETAGALLKNIDQLRYGDPTEIQPVLLALKNYYRTSNSSEMAGRCSMFMCEWLDSLGQTPQSSVKSKTLLGASIKSVA